MRKEKGFTLLEVLIVVAIIVVLAFIGSRMVAGTFKTKSRELAWRMASTTRYLYTSAITENKTIRLVFDFESNSYWAESTNEKFLLDTSEDKDREKKEEKKETKDEDTKGKDGEEKSSYLEPNEATFGSMESSFLETRQLSAGIYLKDVQTTHDKLPITAGRAYIYFFSNGSAEPAVINFRDEADEKHLSVKIDPYSGEADLSREYRTLQK